MTSTEHSAYLGQLVHNFQCLETWLRFVLLELESHTHPPAALDFETLAPGTSVSVDAVTDHSDLGKLIRRFNEHMTRKGAKRLNPALVSIRDAIAHGRVLGTTTGFPLRLIKFSTPKVGQVTLTVNEVMSHHWFKLQIQRTYRAIETVRTEA